MAILAQVHSGHACESVEGLIACGAMIRIRMWCSSGFHPLTATMWLRPSKVHREMPHWPDGTDKVEMGTNSRKRSKEPCSKQLGHAFDQRNSTCLVCNNNNNAEQMYIVYEVPYQVEIILQVTSSYISYIIQELPCVPQDLLCERFASTLLHLSPERTQRFELAQQASCSEAMN
jgi:hypothetical protein